TAPVGASGAGFATNCLAVVPNQAFTVDFTNDDTGVPHNWALFTNASATTAIEDPGTTPVSAPGSQTYDIKALPPGQYYFRCNFHPTTMEGTLVVAAPGKASPSPTASGASASPSASP